MGKGMIAGKNSVLEALKARQHINKIFIATGASSGSVANIISLAKEQKIPVSRVERKKLDEMCENAKHQGVLASVPPKEYSDFHQLTEEVLENVSDPVLVLLDEIEDPHNLGAIVRSVEGFGGKGVVIPKHRAVPLTESVYKAAAGALNHVPIARVTNLVQSIEHLKKKGFWVIGTDADADSLAYDVKLDGPLAIVIGSEGKGMGRLVKENCDIVIKLPMQGKINSLNASVAAGIVMYEITRQRKSGLR